MHAYTHLTKRSVHGNPLLRSFSAAATSTPLSLRSWHVHEYKRKSDVKQSSSDRHWHVHTIQRFQTSRSTGTTTASDPYDDDEDDERVRALLHLRPTPTIDFDDSRAAERRRQESWDARKREARRQGAALNQARQYSNAQPTSDMERWHVARRPPIPAKTRARRILEALLSLFGLSSLIYLYSTHIDTVPLSGRRRLVLMSEEVERQWGHWAFESHIRNLPLLPPDDDRSRLVEQVGRRIAAATGEKSRAWEWEFVVVDDEEEVNAICFPGGKVVVYTGLVNVLYAREQAYRERLKELGLKPIDKLEEEVAAIAAAADGKTKGGGFISWWARDQPSTTSLASSSTHAHHTHRNESYIRAAAAAWPWEEPMPAPPPQLELFERMWNFFTQQEEAAEDKHKVDMATATVSTSPHVDHPSSLLPPTPLPPLPLPPSSSPTPDAPPLRPHPHEFDSRGLRVDRGLLSNHLAVVLGHEIAHAILRHSAESISTMIPLAILNLVSNSSTLIKPVFDFLWHLPYSRLHESEADRLGLVLMARACFHPGAAPSFWRDIAAHDMDVDTDSGSDSDSETVTRTGSSRLSRSLQYFSTHPHNDVRAENVTRWYEEAKLEMRRCCR